MGETILKFGLSFRPPHYQWVTENLPQVGWFEIITENFFSSGGKPRRYLEKLRENYPIATHGMNLSIASIDPPNFDYLRKLKELVDWLKPGIVSDHLSWSYYQGIQSHDLLPVPYTMECLEHVIQKVEQVQDYLNRQIVLENPAQYLIFNQSEMTEVEFFTELCRSTGCGILLDLNSLYINWKNLGLNPFDVIESLPVRSVKQLHLAGHSVQNGVLVDSHDAPVSEGVWELYRKAITQWPTIPVLIEWDEQIPSFESLMTEVAQAKAIHSEVMSSPVQLPFSFETPRKRKHYSELHLSDQLNNTLWGRQQETLHHLIHSPSLSTAKALEFPLFEAELSTSVKKGITIYWNHYGVKLRSVLQDTFPVLAFVTQEPGFESLISQYIYQCPPTKDPMKYVGENFPQWIRETSLKGSLGIDQEILADLALLEWSRVEVFDYWDDPVALKKSVIQDLSPKQWEKVRFRFAGSLRLIHFNWDIGSIWESVKTNRTVPDLPMPLPAQYLVYRRDNTVFHRKLKNKEAVLLREMMEGYSFLQSCSTLAGSENKSEVSQVIPIAVQFLQTWLEDELIVKMFFEAY